ncbi:MAG: tyrosine-type recombinase/integrase [Gammaproteobacteria bacterium]|nr:tyrosine-type recombinase/integrase [Gammaproteobacteria bacterium]
MSEKRSLKLTASSVADLVKIGFVGDAWDTDLSGFHVRGGKRGLTFRYYYRNKITRKQEVFTLGRFGVLTVDQARKECRAIAGTVALGGDPMAMRRDQQQEADRAKLSTLGAYLDGPHADYLKKRKSGDHTAGIIRAHFGDWMDRPMESLTHNDLKAWIVVKQAAGLKWATIVRTLTAIKTLLNQAAKKPTPVIAANPFHGFNLDDEVGHLTQDELAEAGSNERHPLTDAEICQLFAGIEAYQNEKREQRRRSRKHGKAHLPDLDGVAFVDHVAPYLLLAYFTGLRPGDIAGLTWIHVQDECRTIRKIIEKTAHKMAKPGKKNGGVQDFPLAAKATDVLTAWWQQCGRPEKGYVFPSNRNPGERMDKNAMQKPWAKVKELGELRENLHLYALRHNFASQLIAAGVDLLTVSRLMGHADIQTTVDHYGHLLPNKAQSAVDGFADRTAQALGVAV